MSSYSFRWPHSANEVYVTGTFDNWAKTEKLDKTANGFEKTVRLPSSSEKILYKFVVDGNWVTDHTAPSETDHVGNVNNILTPEHLRSSVASASTSSAVAGQAAHDKSIVQPSSELPGQFPITPANELQQQFFAKPIPATSGAGNPVKLAPGEKVPEPSSYTSNDINSNVRLDKESYEGAGLGAAVGAGATAAAIGAEQYSVKPLPATAGAGNPVKLAPGEKVPEPSSYTSGTLNSNVRLDKESYEKSGSGIPQLPPVLNSQEQKEAEGASIFGVPSVGGTTFIPESSLPMDSSAPTRDVTDPTISSTGPKSTTSRLAGQQPLESRGVPAVVADSQHAAHASPEAAASRTAVQEKSVVENELLRKVPESAPTAGQGVIAGSTAPQSFGLPPVVANSQHSAHASPEASASRTAVQEKSAVEDELLAKVPESAPTSESGLLGKSEKGGIIGAATGAAAGAAVGGIAATEAAISSVAPNSTTANLAGRQPVEPRGVPEVVTESQQTAHAAPEASSVPSSVVKKDALEDELLAKVPEAASTSESGLVGKSEKGYLGMAAGGVAAAGAAVAGAAYAAKDTVAKQIPQQAQSNILPVSHQDTVPSTNGVPEVVTESQQQAHAAPEASASAEAVKEKAAVEKELEQRVRPSNATGEPAPSASAALSSTAPVKPTTENTSTLSSSTPTKPTTDTSAFGAADTTPGRSLAPGNRNEDSRDVSPLSKPGEPSTATAVAAGAAPPSTPQKATSAFKNTPERKGTPSSIDTGSPANSEAKKKRRSFFGKLKDKLKS